MNQKDVHNLIGGDLINPNPEHVIKGIKPVDEASDTDIAFILYSIPKSIQTSAKVIVCKQKIESFPFTQIIHSQPRLAMAKLLDAMFPNGTKTLTHNISQQSNIDKTANVATPVMVSSFSTIGKNTVIDANTIIHENVTIGKNCKLGKHCIIWPNVTIYDNTIIGNNAIIHSNSVVGSDGFGYEKSDDKWVKINHIGHVEIGNNVEIGSNTSIDRGALSTTVIGHGVKIDNQIQIGHNCKIGEDTVIASGSLIAGSVIIGSRCIIAGGVNISDNITIGNEVVIFARSGVTKNIADKAKVSGFPAINHKDEVKRYAFLNRLFKE